MIIDARKAEEALYGGRPFSLSSAIRNEVVSLKVGESINVNVVYDTCGKIPTMQAFQIGVHVAVKNTSIKVSTKKERNGSMTITRLA